jgi:hypothetical protein
MRRLVIVGLIREAVTLPQQTAQAEAVKNPSQVEHRMVVYDLAEKREVGWVGSMSLSICY